MFLGFMLFKRFHKTQEYLFLGGMKSIKDQNTQEQILLGVMKFIKKHNTQRISHSGCCALSCCQKTQEHFWNSLILKQKFGVWINNFM
jgi:hypothetical protein